MDQGHDRTSFLGAKDVLVESGFAFVEFAAGLVERELLALRSWPLKADRAGELVGARLRLR